MLEMSWQSSGSVGQSIQINPPPNKTPLYSLYNFISLWCTVISSYEPKTVAICAVCLIVWNMDLISRTLQPICHRVFLDPITFIYA